MISTTLGEGASCSLCCKCINIKKHLWILQVSVTSIYPGVADVVLTRCVGIVLFSFFIISLFHYTETVAQRASAYSLDSFGWWNLQWVTNDENDNLLFCILTVKNSLWVILVSIIVPGNTKHTGSGMQSAKIAVVILSKGGNCIMIFLLISDFSQRDYDSLLLCHQPCMMFDRFMFRGWQVILIDGSQGSIYVQHDNAPWITWGSNCSLVFSWLTEGSVLFTQAIVIVITSALIIDIDVNVP